MCSSSPSCCPLLVGFLLLLGPMRAHLSGCQLARVSLSVTACQWITACLQESERRRCVCITLSVCQRVNSCLCVRRPPSLLWCFSTADSSQPTPEVGGTHVFHPQKILNILRLGVGEGGSRRMSPHDRLVCVCLCMGVTVSCAFVC